MSVRMRHTKSHTANRRSHHALTAAKAVKDKESGALRLPHRVDETTGRYRGKQVAERPAKKAAPSAKTHEHEHGAHTPAPEEKVEGSKGIAEKVVAERPHARSGA